MNPCAADPSWSFSKISNDLISLARNSILSIENQFIEKERELANSIVMFSKFFNKIEQSQRSPTACNAKRNSHQIESPPLRPSDGFLAECSVADDISASRNPAIIATKTSAIDYAIATSAGFADVSAAENCSSVAILNSVGSDRSPLSSVKSGIANNKSDRQYLHVITSPIVMRTRSRRKALPDATLPVKESKSRRKARKRDQCTTEANLSDTMPGVFEDKVGTKSDGLQNREEFTIDSPAVVIQIASPTVELDMPKSKRCRKERKAATIRQRKLPVVSTPEQQNKPQSSSDNLDLKSHIQFEEETADQPASSSVECPANLVASFQTSCALKSEQIDSIVESGSVTQQADFSEQDSMLGAKLDSTFYATTDQARILPSLEKYSEPVFDNNSLCQKSGAVIPSGASVDGESQSCASHEQTQITQQDSALNFDPLKDLKCLDNLKASQDSGNASESVLEIISDNNIAGSLKASKPTINISDLDFSSVAAIAYSQARAPSQQCVPNSFISLQVQTSGFAKPETSLLQSLLEDDNMSDSEEIQPPKPNSLDDSLKSQFKHDDRNRTPTGMSIPNVFEVDNVQGSDIRKSYLPANDKASFKNDQRDAPFLYRSSPQNVSQTNPNVMDPLPVHARHINSGVSLKPSIPVPNRPPSFLSTDNQPMFLSLKSSQDSKTSSGDSRNKSIPPVSGMLQSLLLKARADSIRRQHSAKPTELSNDSQSSMQINAVAQAVLANVVPSKGLISSKTEAKDSYHDVRSLKTSNVPAAVKFDSNEPESIPVVSVSSKVCNKFRLSVTDVEHITESQNPCPLTNVSNPLIPVSAAKSKPASVCSDTPSYSLVSDRASQQQSSTPEKLEQGHNDDDLEAENSGRASNDNFENPEIKNAALYHMTEYPETDLLPKTLGNGRIPELNASDPHIVSPSAFRRSERRSKQKESFGPKHAEENKVAATAARQLRSGVSADCDANASDNRDIPGLQNSLSKVLNADNRIAQVPVAKSNPEESEKSSIPASRDPCLQTLIGRENSNGSVIQLPLPFSAKPKAPEIANCQSSQEPLETEIDPGEADRAGLECAEPDQPGVTYLADNLWDSLSNGFSNISTNVASFIRPKVVEAKTKRIVEVKALKLATAKRKRDLEREEEIRLRNKKFQEAGEERKRKMFGQDRQKESTLPVSTDSSLVAAPSNKMLVKSQESQKKPAERLVELSTEERRKRAEDRRLALEEQERRKRHEKEQQRQFQRELLKNRRKEDDSTKKRPKHVEESSKKPCDDVTLQKDIDVHKQPCSSVSQPHKFAVPRGPAPRHLTARKSQEDRRDSDPVVEIPTEPDPSDYESDEESRESDIKKKIPKWAQNLNLLNSLTLQTSVDPDTIFNPDYLKTCNLSEMFLDFSNKSRFTKRTSSGNWLQDRLGWREELEYKRRNGFLE